VDPAARRGAARGPGVLKAAFVRTVGEADRFYVTRSDGSEASWSSPTYGDALPHDLIHLVVESAFGLSRGFWGRVDEGVDPKIVNDQANRKGGADKYAAYGSDRAELDLAEALATTDWSSDTIEVGLAEACARMRGPAPPPVTAEQVREMRSALAALGARWRALRLRPRGALDLTFDRTAPKRSFEGLLDTLTDDQGVPLRATPPPGRVESPKTPRPRSSKSS
jgi:hypothetical protein